MRTVVENKAERSDLSVDLSTNYVHLSQWPLRSRSCFYDYGERQQVRVTYSPESEGGKFIESLMKEICD